MEEAGIKRISVALILLLVLSVILSGYGIYRITISNNKITAVTAEENIKQDFFESYSTILSIIIFLVALLCFTIIITIIRLKKYVEIKENAMFDQLTRLHNRHYFIKRFEEEIDRSKRYKHPLSVLMLDLDNFKKFNDKYGHNKGDLLLKTVATIMQSSTRKIDVIGRWGGEEFVILLPETQGRDAYVVAERIRTNIVNLTHSTVSIGLVYYKYYYPEIKEIIDNADHLMYKAKQTGKNKICYK